MILPAPDDVFDPRARRVLAMVSAGRRDSGAETPRSRRDGLDQLAALAGGGGAPSCTEEDHILSGPGGPLKLRLFRPEGGRGLRPGCLYLHGGGWVAGGLESHDGVCRRLAAASGRTIAALAYRLAPEHPAPAALDDALSAWTALHADPARFGLTSGPLALAGDSAGGALAASLSLQAEIRPERLLLICPILALEVVTPSRRQFAHGHFVEAETFAADVAAYCPDPAARADLALNPLHVRDLSALPPLILHTAAFDPFRDEGEDFARRARDAGVPTEQVRHPGQIHYFYALPGLIPQAETALAQMGAALGARSGGV